MATHVFGITSIPLKHKEITRLLNGGNTVWIGQRGKLLYKILLPPHDSSVTITSPIVDHDDALKRVLSEDDGRLKRTVAEKVAKLTEGNGPE